MFSLIITLIGVSNNSDFFLYVADSNLILYPTQSSLISDHFAIFDFNFPVIQINRLSKSFQKFSSINKPMCVNSLFNQLSNSISFDLYTIFDYFNLALPYSLAILVPSITLISRTYYKFSWFNIELVNLRKLLRRLQPKYASYKLESDLISFKVFHRFTRKNFSLPNCHITLICSVIMEYILSKLINYLSP